jgi:DNA-binding CsgD family transcriptional regulator
MHSLESVVSDDLTPQELVVLRRLARPGTYAEIGDELFVSRNTVKSHVSHIFMKLGVTSRESAISRARHAGLFGADTDLSDAEARFVLTEAIARKYFVDVAWALHAHDWALYERLHRPDAVRISPVSTCYGIDTMITRNQQIADAVPDRRVEMVNLTVDHEHNRAIFECIHSGTLAGPLTTPHGLIPPTGKGFRFVGVDVVTFDETGLAAEIRRYWDLHEVLREQGLVSH